MLFDALNFTVEKISVVAPSRTLKAEYTIELVEPMNIFIGNRLWNGSTEHGIKLIEDILRDQEPQGVKIRTEDGEVLWEAEPGVRVKRVETKC